tara:strand:+ start:1684 stop:1974 length:291 start_codon:yes stop_codon:yes gene_type:complete
MLIKVVEVVAVTSNDTDGRRTYKLEESSIDAWKVTKVKHDSCLQRTFAEHPEYFPEDLDKSHAFCKVQIDRGHGMDVTVLADLEEIHMRVNKAREK